ncbi:MAG: DUF397 domain-containing protein [Patescibacteria group bacterium]
MLEMLNQGLSVVRRLMVAGTSKSEGEFKKSSFSAKGYFGDCVEVSLGKMVVMRDSKNPTGGTLSFTQSEWTAFIAGCKASEFDLK